MNVIFCFVMKKDHSAAKEDGFRLCRSRDLLKWLQREIQQVGRLVTLEVPALFVEN